MRKSLASTLLAAIGVVHASTIRRTLEISDKVIAPDGFSRSATVVNGLMPGPVLTATKGDDFLIAVVNSLTDPEMLRATTIHWHGILQPKTAYDDGPAWVTQCPISPGYNYTYRVELGLQTGTYWYHSHLGAQYVDGLRGALIIYDPDDPHGGLYDVDDQSTIIALTDWYQHSALKLGEDWINNKTAEPVPDSNLFNGVGRCGGPNCTAVPRPVMMVKRGKRYRFRIINSSAIVPFNFAIEGHSLTVIEADGINHQPLNVSSLEISTGQRYSVVLNANQPVANYWISYPSNFRDVRVPEVNPNYNGTEAFAILRYSGAPTAEPTTPQFVPDDSNALQEWKLVPLVSPNYPDQADQVLDLNFRPAVIPPSVATPGGANKWLINDIQYQPPSVPTLLRILHAAAYNQTEFAPSEATYNLPRDKVIDVRLIGDPDHPFHLHGHTFQVIQSANGTRNTRNPPIRDTVDTNDEPAAGTPVTIRFHTGNPGPWFLHCHKDWHLEAGLAVVFAEDIPDQQEGPQSLRPPRSWDELCDIYNQTKPDAGH